MTASVEIITQEKDNILLVPISSVTTKTEKDSLGDEKIKQVVFIQDGNKAKMIEVETGISDFENIEIISELKENDKVISGPYIAISQKLKDGNVINVTKINDKKVDAEDQKKSGIRVEIGS